MKRILVSIYDKFSGYLKNLWDKTGESLTDVAIAILMMVIAVISTAVLVLAMVILYFGFYALICYIAIYTFNLFAPDYLPDRVRNLTFWGYMKLGFALYILIIVVGTIYSMFKRS